MAQGDSEMVTKKTLTTDLLLQSAFAVLACGVAWGAMQSSLADTEQDVADLTEAVAEDRKTIQRIDKTVVRLETRQHSAVTEQRRSFQRIEKRIEYILQVVEKRNSEHNDHD